MVRKIRLVTGLGLAINLPKGDTVEVESINKLFSEMKKLFSGNS